MMVPVTDHNCLNHYPPPVEGGVSRRTGRAGANAYLKKTPRLLPQFNLLVRCERVEGVRRWRIIGIRN